MTLDALARLSAALPAAAASLAPAAGLHPATLRFSLERLAAGYGRDHAELRGLLARRPAAGLALHVVLPANTLAPLINVTAAAGLAGARLTVHPAAGMQAAAEAWRAWLENIWPDFEWAAEKRDDTPPADVVAVFGSDETIATMAERFAGRRFLGFGHRFAAAYVDLASEEALAAAVRDVIPWDQNGCLSPRTFFVHETGAGEAMNWAERLARALESAEVDYPRAPVAAAASLAIRTARLETRLRPGGRVWESSGNTSWSVFFDPIPALEAWPGGRTARVKPCAGWEAAREALASDWAHVEAVGIAAAPERLLELQAGQETDRVIRLGEMQSPSLRRRQSGQPPLLEVLLQ